jgi:hypothetical protein
VGKSIRKKVVVYGGEINKKEDEVLISLLML